MPARHNRVPDIGRDDPKAQLEGVHLQGDQHKLVEPRCGDIMTRQQRLARAEQQPIGIPAQSDAVAAWCRPGAESAA